MNVKKQTKVISPLKYTFNEIRTKYLSLFSYAQEYNDSVRAKIYDDFIEDLDKIESICKERDRY